MLSSPKPQPMLISILLLSLIMPLTTLAAIAESSLATTPTTIPLFSLPTAFPNSLTPQNPALDLQIRNTLSHYPLAIDGKNFPALSLVFTQDVVANYSAPLGVLTGLASVISTLEANLGCGGGGENCDLFNCDAFWGGEYYGEVVYAYAQYQDDWVQICCPEEWRIKARTEVYMGPLLGNLSIFT
ncbi:hypothetical protein JMJ35_000936 [Cladonia borealis]|uniref:SnoaL-like domain-containing protein n=1 Tax=Cladonia borealis TaxID=184061 RepID=A0AA39R7M1_9LECA|nr:hypothetical protein JMJ35_000936 [Cladonia borealis]